MENLGAVTFRETLLLIDQKLASKSDLQTAADVIAHEIAHMWFGDLVTMLWWNGLWLNEAFATFAEISCSAKFRPEWDRWTSFSRYRSMAQDVDALLSTRPIEFPVISPTDAEGMFDVLTYEKGASVVRMLEQYLGEERFRDGVREYLRAHSFANAETTDLWDAIEAVTKEPVRSTMDGWIFQGGYPVVNASLSGTTLTLSQRPFTYLPPTANTTWQVPLLYRLGAADQPDATQRLLLGSDPVAVEVPAGTTTVVLNSGGHGFYRSSYDATLLAGLRASLGELAAAERFQLVSDFWANVMAGHNTPDEFLELAESFTAERDPSVWAQIITGLRTLVYFSPAEKAEALRVRVRALLGPVAAELTWQAVETESPQTKELRGQLLSALGIMAEDATTVEAANAQLSGVLSHDTNIDPDVAPAIISIGAHTGDAVRYNEYLEAFTTASTPQEQRRYLFGRGMFRDPELVDRTLEACLTDEIRTQDAPYLIGQMVGHPVSGPTAWAFVERNWTTIVERFPSNSLPRLIEGVVSLVEPVAAARCAAFFATGAGTSLAASNKSVVQHLERQRVNCALRDRLATP